MDRKLFYIEIVMALLVGLSFGLIYLDMSLVGRIMLVMSITGLTLLYLIFIGSFYFPTQGDIKTFDYWFLRLCYVVMGLTVLTVALKLMLVHFAGRYLFYGLLVSVLMIVLLLFELFLTKDAPYLDYFTDVLIRALLVTAVAFLFYLTPLNRLVNLYFSAHPEYAEKLIKYLEKPGDEKYRKEWEEAWEKYRHNQ